MSLRTTIVRIAATRGFTRVFRAVLVAAALIAALTGLARAQHSRSIHSQSWGQPEVLAR